MQKTYFTTEPDRVLFKPLADGSAEVYLRRNIEERESEEGGWQADEVFFTTNLSQAEVEAQFDSYFMEEPEPTIADVVEALDTLTQIILEG